jgi:predicted O-methyltransferase YrrM
MSVITPTPVRDYLVSLRRLPHPELEIVAREGLAQGIPIVDPQTGALLHTMVQATGARRVLEIGTAIGYSGLWIASALPPDGQLMTLERDATRAERVAVIVGDAARYLHKIAGPFDLIFQDGDKAQYELMLDRLTELLRPLGTLVTDNILWNGEVVPGFVSSPQKNADDTKAIAAYNRRLALDPHLETTFLPIGDGVAISIKQDAA